MRAEVAAAERKLEVREAATGWRDAGVIDEPTFHAIEASYPDDRVRLNFWIRVLAFLATLIGAVALAALVAMLVRLDAEVAPWILAPMAATCFLFTEIQTGRLRRAQAGSETATALLATLLAWLALIFWLREPPTEFLLLAGIVLCALAAWRWGSVILTGVFTITTFALFARWPHGRIFWIVLAALLVPIAFRISRSIRFAPSHRRAAEIVVAGSLIAVYVAVNLYSLDRSFVESLGDRGVAAASTWLRWVAAAGTALLPPMFLAAGVVLRNRMGLVLGAASIAASLATLRHYHPIGPLWLCLTLGGASCLAAALGLRRWLSSAAGKERSGFTAEPLFESARGREAAKIAAAIATVGPSPRTAPASSFEGGGGLSGGGGASGTS